jgi:hypothetical protein
VRFAGNRVAGTGGYALRNNSKSYHKDRDLHSRRRPDPFVNSSNVFYHIAFDSSGNLFASDQFNNEIFKITPDGNMSLFASGVNTPNGMAFQSSVAAATPEPGSLALLTGLALSGTALVRNRRRQIAPKRGSSPH